MKLPSGIALILLGCFLACGCMEQPPVLPGSINNTFTPSETQVIPATIPAEPIIASLSDTRPAANLTLDPGVIVVSFHTKGPADILAWFTTLSSSEYGAMNELSTKGPYSGSVAFQVPEQGTYVLNMTGRGNWTAEVYRMHAMDPLKIPLNLSGAGTLVTPVFYLEKGEYIFERNETLGASPLYFISHLNGSPLMDQNNSFIEPGFGRGSPDPFRLITIPESGEYYLCTISGENPDAWSVSISPIPAIPFMGPGPVINWSGGNTTI